MMRAIVDARLLDGQTADVLIDGSQILSVGPDAGANAEDHLDAAGGLVIPAYIDTHIHLDKVLIRDQLTEHDGTLPGRSRPSTPLNVRTPVRMCSAGHGR